MTRNSLDGTARTALPADGFSVQRRVPVFGNLVELRYCIVEAVDIVATDSPLAAGTLGEGRDLLN